jgi:hypothetical protein
VTDYWFPLSLIAATLGLTLARAVGVPVSGWLVATPLLVLLATMLAAYACIRVYAYRHRGDAMKPGLEASSHTGFVEVHKDVSVQRLEMVEPVRTPDGHIDVEASMGQLSLRDKVPLWVRLHPGGRRMLRLQEDFIRNGLEDINRREEG